MTPFRKTTSAALVASAHVLLAPLSASASDATLLHACFPPPALATIAGEETVVKGNHRYDPPAKLDGVALAPPVPDALRGSIRRVDLPAGQKAIALTFDLCEQRGEIAGYDGRIVDYLRREGIKATFFAGGKWMVSHRARTEQLMIDPLFELGNHTETHANLRLLTPAAARQQILAPQKIYEDTRAHLTLNQCVSTQAGLESAIAPQLRLFRFPYGACNDATMKAVNDAGMLAIQWDVATGDPNPNVSAAALANAMVREAKPGSIIVNHANGRGWHTAEALPIAIPKLKAKGYTFVTVSELLAMGKPVITPECFDRKPGDTNRYDFLTVLEHPLRPPTPMAHTTAPASASTQAKSGPAPEAASHPKFQWPGGTEH